MLSSFFVIFSFLFILVSTINPPSAFAVTTPDFPSCSNPSGILRVEHKEGTHGVAGNINEYKGKDSVFNINDTQILQCLCTEDEEGIQTNWWKISSLNDSEIQTLKNQGWHYVASGSLWGLHSAPYMAKNSEYECTDATGGGAILGAATNLLGLAKTGDKALLYSIFGIGVGFVFLLLGLIIILRAKK